MLTSFRRRLAALGLVLLVPLLGACGFGYQTDQVYQPAVGVNDQSGEVDVLGATVVSGTDGSGTFIASLANKNPDKSATLTAVTSPDDVEVQLVKPVEIEPGDMVNMAELGAVRVSGEQITPGSFVRLNLQFESGQTSEVNAPVVDKEGAYDDVAPAIPSSAPTP